MKITVIHGQSHEGSTCMAARMLAQRIRKDAGRRGCNARAKKWFALMRLAHRLASPMGPDYEYWKAQGWHGKARPWRA